MNYNSLFDFLYSTEISEATKVDVVSKMDEPIQESKKHVVFKQDLEDANIRKLKRDNPNILYVEDEYLDIDGSQAAKRKRMEDKVNKNEALVETYIDLLDTLVLSTASEALIYDIIDEVFSSVDEAIINEVSDQWIKRKTEAGLKSRKETLDKANKSLKSGAIGLSQFRNQEKAQQRYDKGVEQVAARTPKAEATSKLKSAVGKVKNWADKVSPFDKGPQHVGLARLIGAKANKENIGAETLRQQTTHKAETPKAEVEQPEVKAEAPKVKKSRATKPKADNTVKAAKKKVAKAAAPKEEKQPEAPKAEEVKSEVKAEDATKAAKVNKPKEEKQPEVKAAKPKADKPKADKVTSPNKKRAEERHQAKKAAKADEVKSEVKAEDATKAAKKKVAKAVKAEEEKQPETKPAEEVKAEAPKAEKVEQPKVEAAKPKEENKEQKPQKSALERLMARSKREAEARDKDIDNSIRIKQERIDKIKASPDGQSKESQEEIKKIEDSIAALKKQHSGTKVHEALSDLAILLAHTNISEDCFVDVMKSVASSTPEAIRIRNFEEIFNSKFQ